MTLVSTLMPKRCLDADSRAGSLNYEVLAQEKVPITLCGRSYIVVSFGKRGIRGSQDRRYALQTQNCSTGLCNYSHIGVCAT